jgi:hypothetical protein
MWARILICEIKRSLAVDEKCAELAGRVLHKAFELDQE